MFHHLLNDAKAAAVHRLNAVSELKLNCCLSDNPRLSAPIFCQFFAPRGGRIARTDCARLFSLQNLLSCGVCRWSLHKNHRKKRQIVVFLRFPVIRERSFKASHEWPVETIHPPSIASQKSVSCTISVFAPFRLLWIAASTFRPYAE